jgi:hypothetical protein
MMQQSKLPEAFSQVGTAIWHGSHIQHRPTRPDLTRLLAEAACSAPSFIKEPQAMAHIPMLRYACLEAATAEAEPQRWDRVYECSERSEQVSVPDVG